MAEKRMFSKIIIDSDLFLDMPLSTQALYFHLSMRADDDGFVNNPKKIQRIIGCGEDDLKLLLVKNFLIPFDSGIVVIKHWRIHNYLRKDRYKETNYVEEKALLGIEPNKAYSLLSENNNSTPLIKNKNLLQDGIPTVDELDTQNRLDKNRLDKNRLDKNRLEEAIVDSCSSFEKNLDVFKYFEKCGFIITGMLMEQVSNDIEIYSKQWLMDAATEAMNRGKINNYKYVLGILQNWASNGKNEVNNNGSFRQDNKSSEEEEKYNFDCY